MDFFPGDTSLQSKSLDFSALVKRRGNFAGTPTQKSHIPVTLIMTRKISAISLALLVFLSINLYPLEWDEQFSLVGIKLSELYEGFGPPETVYAARGNELWQDDVVFQYTGKEFYIFRDRVWQVKFSSVYGISVNDPKQAAMLRLGITSADDDYALFPLHGGNWPLTLRVNFTAGIVSAIYVYRSDL
jgi:hypothetical protein